MIVKYTWAMALAAIGCLSATATAETFKNEPSDFRGVTWGSSLDRIAKDLLLVRTDDEVRVYKRTGESLNIGQGEAFKIAYRFYKNQFSVGVIQTYGAPNSRALRDMLVTKYGEPRRLSKRQELDAWEGDKVMIVLSCSVTSYCAAEFISRDMIALEEKETGAPVQVLERDDD
jgi:hypothetical protein